MRKNFLKLGALSLLSVCLLTNTSTVHATTKTIDIPALGDGYTVCSPEVRSGVYNYCTTRCITVHPQGNTDDNFKFMRVRMRYKENGMHLLSSTNPGSDYDYYVSTDKNYKIEEGKGSFKIPIKDDKMYVKNVYFEFCGNSVNYSAEARVSYNAK